MSDNNTLPSKYDKLFKLATDVRENATALYSSFKVGAVIKTKSGKFYSGANAESSSYGLSICAERVALFNALSAGERDFEEIIIVADFKNSTDVCRPCGACRQLLFDYAKKDLKIIMTNTNRSNYDIDSIENLLKNGFQM